MKIKKCLFWLLILGMILNVTPAEADESTAQTEYWGTVGRGMGGAYTAAGGDIGGISYNPANSATILQGQFTTDYNRLSQLDVDVNNSAFAGAYRTGDFVQGLALYRTDLDFDFGNFQHTTGLELDYTDDIFYYNLGYNLSDDMHLGSNIKYYNVSTDVEDGDATGYGLDLGYMQFIGDQLTFGASVKNLISDKEWDSGTSEDVPLEARLGLRARPIPDVAIEGDLVYGEDPGLRSLNFGGEWWLWRRFEDPDPMLRRAYFRRLQRETTDRVQFGVALRSGLEIETAGSQETNFSAGLGMQFGDGFLNYSFQERSDFDNQHFFGLSVTFGEPENEGSNIEQAEVEEPDTDEDETEEMPETQAVTWDTTQELGLLQWNTDDVNFDVRRFESELTAVADFETVVYGENQSLQEALLEGTVSLEQIEQLLEQTGQQSLITGELQLAEENEYRARLIIATAEARDEVEITAQSFEELYAGLVEQVNTHLN